MSFLASSSTLNAKGSNSSFLAVTAGAAAAFVGGSLLTAIFLKADNKTTTVTFPATDNTPKKKTTSDAGNKVASASTTTLVSYPEYDYANDNKGSFMKVCDMMIQDLMDELPTNYDLPPRETQWLEKMLNYTVKGGKMNRGLMVVESGVAIMGKQPSPSGTNGSSNYGGVQQQPLDNTTLCRLAVLGWAIEWLQAWLLVADDIMDGSVTRRGQACWYKTLGDTWYIAINDAVTIESLVYKTIKKHFSYDAKVLLQLLDLLMETTFQTELGQLSDTLCDILQLPDLTPDRWELIVTYKTAFYSFYLSVAFAMVLAGVHDEAAYNAAREILITMGVYFQAQDDFLDCYGTPEQIGKVGTDIADKKCGWLFTKAYHQLADAKQKALLDKHYGKCKVGTPEEQLIKDLYTELGLPKLYADYEQSSYDNIMALKDSQAGATLASAGVPWAVFEKFLAKVYKRSK